MEETHTQERPDDVLVELEDIALAIEEHRLAGADADELAELRARAAELTRWLP